MLLKNTDQKCKSVDEYEKVNRICSGSFGSVYRVRHKKTQKMFALKRMNPSMCHDTNGFSILYIREVMILRQIQHRNIIRIEEVVEGAEVNDFFIVMECCDVDLKLFIQRVNPMRMEVVKYLTGQLLEGLRFLHSTGVLHRDLKPSNVLLMKDGCLKIADFGLARKLNERMTSLVVTLWYRPIEVLLGSEAYTEAIDMWSLGCIVGEMLKGRPILAGEGEIDQLGKIFHLLGFPSDEDFDGLELPHHRNIKRPKDAKSHFNDDFGGYEADAIEFVLNLLSFNPRKRYSAEEALSIPFFQEMPNNIQLSAIRIIEDSIGDHSD